jgi:hypothetical protein
LENDVGHEGGGSDLSIDFTALLAAVEKRIKRGKILEFANGLGWMRGLTFRVVTPKGEQGHSFIIAAIGQDLAAIADGKHGASRIRWLGEVPRGWEKARLAVLRENGNDILEISVPRRDKLRFDVTGHAVELPTPRWSLRDRLAEAIRERVPPVNNALIDVGARHDGLPDWLAIETEVVASSRCLLATEEIGVFEDADREMLFILGRTPSGEIYRTVLGDDDRLAFLGLVDEDQGAIEAFAKSIRPLDRKANAIVPPMVSLPRAWLPPRPHIEVVELLRPMWEASKRLEEAADKEDPRGEDQSRNRPEGNGPPVEPVVVPKRKTGGISQLGGGSGRPPHSYSGAEDAVVVPVPQEKQQHERSGAKETTAAAVVVPQENPPPSFRTYMDQPEWIRIGPRLEPPVQKPRLVDDDILALIRGGESLLGRLELVGYGLLRTDDGAMVRMIGCRKDERHPERGFLRVSMDDFRRNWLLVGIYEEGEAWLVPMDLVFEFLSQAVESVAFDGKWNVFVETLEGGTSRMWVGQRNTRYVDLTGLEVENRHFLMPQVGAFEEDVAAIDIQSMIETVADEVRSVDEEIDPVGAGVVGVVVWEEDHPLEEEGPQEDIDGRRLSTRVRNLVGWALDFARPLGRRQIHVADDLVVLDDPRSRTLTAYFVDEDEYAFQVDFKGEARARLRNAWMDGAFEDEIREMLSTFDAYRQVDQRPSY